jgi:polyketide biosynthesis enoyl-CoA hydratase PksH
MGFVAASDVVIAGQNAKFGLSELLFGLYPACVLPFLIRRAGFQRANYMTLMTQPFSSRQALEWGVVDAVDQESRTLLLRHLTRLKCLPKTGILRYKSYTGRLYGFLPQSKSLAVEGNMEVSFRPAKP